MSTEVKYINPLFLMSLDWKSGSVAVPIKGHPDKFVYVRAVPMPDYMNLSDGVCEFADKHATDGDMVMNSHPVDEAGVQKCDEDHKAWLAELEKNRLGPSDAPGN